MSKWIAIILLLLAGIGMGYLLWQKYYSLPVKSPMGIAYGDYEARLSIEPKAADGVPFYADISDKWKYPEDRYKVYELPEQKKVIIGATGFFLGWKNLANSTDKVILVKPGILGKIYKFRISPQKNPEWLENDTIVNQYDKKGEISNRTFLYKMTNKEKSQLFRWGKEIYVESGYFVPGGVRIDKNNVIWTSNVYLRG